jgi:hypothetical protein
MMDMITITLVTTTTLPVLVYVIASAVMPARIAVATATIDVAAPVEWLFKVIAEDRRQTFRSDLSDVKVLSRTRWRELANDSPPVDYEEVRSVANHLFEAHFHGLGFTGRWLVRFSMITDTTTTIYIYEEVRVKNALLRPIIRATYPLQNAVDRFVADLLDASDDAFHKAS